VYEERTMVASVPPPPLFFLGLPSQDLPFFLQRVGELLTRILFSPHLWLLQGSEVSDPEALPFLGDSVLS